MTSRRQLHIFIAESDRGIREMLALVFQREGWIVTTAADGQHALNLLHERFPDALLIDLWLSRVSGLEILDWIGATDPSWLSHVIVVSGAPSHVLADLARRHAVGAVIAKPFNIAELVTHVEACANTAHRSERRTGPAVSETTP